MIQKDAILEAYTFRHACKVFDQTKTIPVEEFEFIMQTARLSPSSFGMEPWRFIVITDQELKEQLKPHCWNQAQITTCSHLVVIVSKTAAVRDDTYIEAMFTRRGLSKEQATAYIERYKNYIKERKMYEWCSRQCYIAGANMATSAAMRGIDSCFIEGFLKEDVEHVLGLDTSIEEVSVLLPLGYRINEQPKKHRLAMQELVELRT